MIFVSVGTQLPFDRMIAIVDRWAKRNHVSDVIAQLGPTLYKPVALKGFAHIAPAEFAAHLRQADLLVSHAGMGSILGALEMGKPLIIMPRRVEFGEHRNDHQLATAGKFKDRAGIYVAMDGDELEDLLDRRHELKAASGLIQSFASPQLVETLKSFIATADSKH